MKIIQTTFGVAAVAIICTSCNNDDNPAPVNKAPGAVEVTTTVAGNSVALSWTPAIDPDGDAVTYDVVLEGNTIASDISATSFSVADLRFEKDYTGKLVAKDSKGETVTKDFSFTTGFMFLKSYEDNGTEYFMEYDEEGMLINIETRYSDHNVIVRNPQGKVTRLGEINFSYNTGGLMNSIDDGKGAGIVAYDSKDRIVRVSTDYNYNPTYNVRVSVDHSYNEQGQLVQIVESHFDFLQRIQTHSRFKLQYDSKGTVFQLTVENGPTIATLGLARTWTYTYDNKKNPWYTILKEQTNFNPVNTMRQDILNSTLSLGANGVYPTYWMSENNVKSSHVNYRNVSSASFENTFTYNDDNYPVTAEIKYTLNASPPTTSYKRWYY